ncbi:MAG: cupin domain-containing protein [Pyrinomonadaceae bacterium]
MRTNYTRLFADNDGESHFENITVELGLADFAPSTPPMGLSRSMAASESVFIGGPTGWTGDWHVSSARNLFVVLSGEWEIEASDGTVRKFSSPDVLLAEDTTGKGHRSRVVSSEASLALVVQLAKQS